MDILYVDAGILENSCSNDGDYDVKHCEKLWTVKKSYYKKHLSYYEL